MEWDQLPRTPYEPWDHCCFRPKKLLQENIIERNWVIGGAYPIIHAYARIGAQIPSSGVANLFPHSYA